MAGVTISLTGSNVTLDKAGNWALVVHSSTAETQYTMTLKAPDDYVITGYDLTAQIWSSNNPNSYVLTASNGTTKTINSTTLQTLSVSGLEANSTDISIVAASASTTTQRWLTMKTLTVTIEPSFVPVNVTYALYESDGETFVSNTVVEQKQNSAISIPSPISSVTYYDYDTEGTIGTEDCTIKVIRTLKSGVVLNTGMFSNNKCYTIQNNRGWWAVGPSASDVNSTVELSLAKDKSDTKQQFAFINYESKYYLYSVSENKFAYADGTKLSLSSDVTSAVAASTVTLQESKATSANDEPVIVTIGGDMFGVSTGKTPDVFKYNFNTDGGNSALIQEAASFDATDALAALQDYFHGKTAFDNAISTLESYSFGTELGEYTLVIDQVDKTDQATTLISNLKALGYSSENLTEAEKLLAGATYNLPLSKFIRLKNTVISGYSYVGTAPSGMAPLVANAADAGIYYVTSDSKIVSYNQGQYLSKNAGAQCTMTNEATFTIGDGGNGTYTFYYGGLGYLIAWTDGKTNRLSSVSDYARFTIEEVTTLPVTISDAGYATLYAPVALTIPEGIVANTVTISNNGYTLELTPIAGTIPANTPVVLSAADGEPATPDTYNFDITTGGSAEGDNVLVGTYAAITAPVGSYVLQKQSETGFYQVEEATRPNVPGFRAYLSVPSNVKAFFLNGGDTDAIMSVFSGIAEGKIFDLSGRKVAKMQKGNTYIVNGKKVNVK